MVIITLGDKMRNKHVLVTGGCGFIGSYVVRELVQHDYIVDIVDDMSAGSLDSLNGLTFRCVPGSLLQAYEDKHPQTDRQPGSILVIEDDFASRRIMERSAKGRWGAIFHLAAMPRVAYSVENPFDSNSTNVTKTLALLENIRNTDTKFVFSSSSAVYGDAENIPTSEYDMTNPQSPYGLQKRIVEDYLVIFGRLYNQHSVCLRYFNVYGPGQDGSSPYSTAVSAWCSALKNGQPLRSDGDGEQSRDLVFVTDVARANRLAAESQDPFRGHSINIGSGVSYTNNQILDKLKSKFPSLQVQNAPAREGDVRATRADISIAEVVINWSPLVSFDDGLAFTLNWWELQ
jgi:UDP-glucose 4-epimerase